MKKTTFFLFAVVASTSLFSCSSDKKAEDPKPKTTADLLAAHDWINTGATVTSGGQTTDAFSSGLFEECSRDDYFHFVNSNNGGTYTINDNIVVCNPTDNEMGTWSLSTDQKKLNITPQGDQPMEVTILELTDSSLKLSSDMDFFGVPLTIETTFKVK